MSTPETTCPTCGSDCNERDELAKAEREIERLTAELDTARAQGSVAAIALEQVTAERDALRAALQRIVDWDAAGLALTDDHMVQARAALAQKGE